MASLFYVYEHWRLDRDECFYVGKGKGGRAFSMHGRNKHHQAIRAKLARIGSGMEVRMVACGLSEADAFALERERIAFWRNAGMDLTNLTDGGEGLTGLKMSEEHKANISAAHKGKKLSEEHRAKLSAANKGKKLPEETRIKMSDAHKRKTMSEETRKKISAAHKGKIVSEETRAKIVAANKRRYQRKRAGEVNAS